MGWKDSRFLGHTVSEIALRVMISWYDQNTPTTEWHVYIFVSLLVSLCMWLSFLLKYIDKFDLMKIKGSLIKDNTLSIVCFVTHGLIKSATQYSLFILYLV